MSFRTLAEPSRKERAVDAAQLLIQCPSATGNTPFKVLGFILGTLFSNSCGFLRKGPEEESLHKCSCILTAQAPVHCRTNCGPICRGLQVMGSGHCMFLYDVSTVRKRERERERALFELAAGLKYKVVHMFNSCSNFTQCTMKRDSP